MYCSSEHSLANASESTLPKSFRLARARSRSWSNDQSSRATPMIGMFRFPRSTSACNAGKIFLKARSPVAPKKTKASELSMFIQSSYASSRGNYGDGKLYGLHCNVSIWLKLTSLDLPSLQVYIWRGHIWRQLVCWTAI